MQELGAFDFGAPAPTEQGERPAAPPSGATTPSAPETVPAELASSAAAPAGPRPTARPALTAEQLRQALAKADPGTRQKLLRLIAGGRSVQQMAPTAAVDGAKRRSLVMQLDTAPGPARAARGTGTGTGTANANAASGPPPTATDAAFKTFQPGPHQPTRPPRPNGQALMQIDEHTELLDAAPPPASPAARKADLQAQLDQVTRTASVTEGVRAEPLAHKVMFPAYDPARHGEDVHGATRRRHEGPIEGHYPAPRQPFSPTYKHPDGRPMTAEENQVEEVLQTQRCEETLGVLAREGVNGLLLSPRDLDAAVVNGVISAEAAATLWKTWAALRPVIHVIEDEPPAPAVSDAIDDEDAEAGAPAGPSDTKEAAADEPAPAMDVPGPGPGTGPAAPAAAPPALQRSEPVASNAEPAPGTEPAAAAAPLASLALKAQAEEPPTLPLPGRQRPAVSNVNASDTAAEAPDRAPAPSRWPRLKARLKPLAWWFVAYCVLVTSSRLAMDAWLRWGHWISGWPGP